MLAQLPSPDSKESVQYPCNLPASPKPARASPLMYLYGTERKAAFHGCQNYERTKCLCYTSAESFAFTRYDYPYYREVIFNADQRDKSHAAGVWSITGGNNGVIAGERNRLRNSSLTL